MCQKFYHESSFTILIYTFNDIDTGACWYLLLTVKVNNLAYVTFGWIEINSLLSENGQIYFKNLEVLVLLDF